MKKCREIRKRLIAMLCAVSMTAVSIPFAFSLQAEAVDKIGTDILEENNGNLNRIPWNNNINVDISSGLSAITVVLDVNNDGNLDIMSVGRGIDSLGTMVYYGTEDSQNPDSDNYMLLGEGLQVRENTNWPKDPVTIYEQQLDEETQKYLYGKFDEGNFVVGESVATRMLIGSTYYLDIAELVRNNFDPDATSKVTRTGSRTNPTEIDGEEVLLTGSGEKNEIKYYWLYDVDGDDKLDLVWFIDQFHGEYGGIKNDKFDDNGVWGDDNGDGIGDDDNDGDDDPQHCWIVWLPNTGTNDAPEYNGEGIVFRTEDGKAIDCYGQCDPQLQDWDGDGDLDLICGSFIDEITFFENCGEEDEKGAPIFAKGRAIPLASDDAGEQVIGELKAELCVLELTNCDWNKDGYMDLVVSEEDGRCFLVQNTGKTDSNGTPIMVHKGYFKAPAGNLQAGCLPTPVSVDWDGDGDEDIICGNSAGYLNFIENVTPEDGDLTNPRWGSIKRLKTPDGEVYRIQAGYNGSTQGPNEKVWGYTMVSVADWDGDGVLDIMHNNIWGKVLWHKGIKIEPDTVDKCVIGDAQPVEVEWSGETPKPKWLWWNPEGDELVTQWRTTPFMIDLPLDENGDGEAERDYLMDLVMMDQEGYLSFYQRYRDDNGVLKLKEGQRIFVDKSSDKNGKTLRLNDSECGDSGKNSYILVDWDQDGDLDLLKTGNAVNTPIYYENISKVAGKYEFCKNGEVSAARTLKQHDVTPTVCDWNNDGVPDLIMSNEDGFFYYLLNPKSRKEVVDEDVKDEVVEDEEKDPYAYLQEYLVAHWDFEGDDALKDKATVGISHDDLSIFDENGVEQTTNNIIVKNGVATVKSSASLKTPEEVAGKPTDLDFNSPFTIFMKVRVDQVLAQQYTLVSKGRIGGTNGAYAVGITDTNNGWFFVDNANRWSKTPFPTNEWRELAVVYVPNYVNQDGTTSSTITYYLADDSQGIINGSMKRHYNTISSQTNGALRQNDARFCIGNVDSDNKIVDTGAIREFDDIRLYNKALTIEELEAVMPDTSVEDALVAHWDFEGDVAGHALMDKAGKSLYPDNLTMITDDDETTTGTVEVSDGVAIIQGAGVALQAEDSDDLDLTGESTIFIRAFVDESGSPQLLNKHSESSAQTKKAYSLSYNNGDQYELLFQRGDSSNGGYAKNYRKSDVVPPGVWKEIAVVLSYNDSGNLKLEMYMSNGETSDSAEDFTQIYFKDDIGVKSIYKNTYPLTIGNQYSLDGDGSAIRKFDDIRLYKKALTAKQICNILPATSEEEEGPIKIACVGDSITYGYNTSNPTTDSYPAQLQEILGTDYEVLNAGVSGNGVLKKLGDDRYYGKTQAYKESLAFNPNIVLMMLGSNDACDNFINKYTMTGWDNEVKAQFKSDYKELLKSYQDLPTNPKIYIMLPTYSYLSPVYKDSKGAIVREYRQRNLEAYIIPALKEIASEQGIEIIDMQSFTKNHSDWFSDSLHPHKGALRQMAGKIATYICPELEYNPLQLVAHWDFEESNGGVYADKASGGRDADILQVAGTDGNVTIENGVATIVGNGGLQAQDSVDLSQTGAMTIFARMKTTDSWFSIVDKYGNDSSYRLNALDGTVAKAITSAPYKGYQKGNKLAINVWREIALVIDKNDSGIITYKVLVSKGETTVSGNDFLVFEEGITCDTRIVDSAVKLTIGNDKDLGSVAATRSFDEVRIYNYALTEDELASLVETSGNTTSTYLSDLKNNVGLEFRPSNTAPSTVNTTQTTVSFRPIADDASQVITVDGATVASEEEWTKVLNSGVNEFKIKVTNGTASKTYTIKVNCTVPTADDLQVAIDEAKVIEQGTYTASSYQALNTAITFAESMVDGTIEDRKVASETLATAVAELTTRLRKADLVELAAKVADDRKDVTDLMGDVDALKAPSSKEIAKIYNDILNFAMGATTVILQPEVTDSIAMVYKSTITNDEDVSMTFTVDGKTTEADVAKVGKEYTFTYPNVYAQDMAQTIEATLTVGDYSRVYKTSFLDYCVDVMNDEKTDVELKDLIVDLVKYGESVQVFRGDVANRNELLTNKFVARQKFISTYTLRDDLWTTMGSAFEAIPDSNVDIQGYVSTVLTGDVNDSYKWSSMRLVLKDEVNLRCKFTASDISNLVVKVTINNQLYEYNKANFKMVADNIYELDFGEIYANEYDKTVTFEFVNGGEAVGQKLSYSVNTYLFNKRNSDTVNLPQLLLAIYKYGLSANAVQSSPLQ